MRSYRRPAKPRFARNLFGEFFRNHGHALAHRVRGTEHHQIPCLKVGLDLDFGAIIAAERYRVEMDLMILSNGGDLRTLSRQQ